MAKWTQDVNTITVSGFIKDDFKFSHRVKQDVFFKATIEVTRKSGQKDDLPLIIPYSKIKKGLKNKYVKVIGHLRSYNYDGEDKRNHVKVFIFVKEIQVYSRKEDFFKKSKISQDINTVNLKGHVCTQTKKKESNNGNTISEFIISLNINNKDYYVHCIAFDQVASSIIKNVDVKTSISINGELHSRDFFTSGSKRNTICEVCIRKFKIM